MGQDYSEQWCQLWKKVLGRCNIGSCRYKFGRNDKQKYFIELQKLLGRDCLQCYETGFIHYVCAIPGTHLSLCLLYLCAFATLTVCLSCLIRVCL